MDRSPGFGSTECNYVRPIQTRFRFGSVSKTLNLAAPSNSPAHYAKGTPSANKTEVLLRLRPLVGKRFQVLFHSPPGVLFTFPSQYWSAIGHQRVFSLRRWSSRIPTEFLVFRGTWVPIKSKRTLSFTGLSPSLASLSRAVLLGFSL